MWVFIEAMTEAVAPCLELTKDDISGASLSEPLEAYAVPSLRCQVVVFML